MAFFPIESIGSHLTVRQSGAVLTHWCFPLCAMCGSSPPLLRKYTPNWTAHGNFTLITRVYFENMPKTVKLIIAVLRRACLVIYEAQCSCAAVNKHDCGDWVMRGVSLWNLQVIFSRCWIYIYICIWMWSGYCMHGVKCETICAGFGWFSENGLRLAESIF